MGKHEKQIANRSSCSCARDLLSASRKRIVLAVLLVVAIASYSMIYFSKTFPITEGWGVNYSILINEGYVPYRDFFYYSMPLNLLIDKVLWAISFDSFFVFRFYRLIERLVMFLVLFFMLSRPRYKFPLWIVWLSCVAGAILHSGSVYDLFGDYNQTAELLFVLLGCTCAMYWEKRGLKERLPWLAAAGTCVGLLLMLKLSVALAAIVLFGLLFIVVGIRSRSRQSFVDLAIAATPAIVMALIFLVWLIANGALTQFLQYTFNADSKGGLAYVVVMALANGMMQNVGLVFFGILFITVMIALRYLKALKIKESVKNAMTVLSYLVLVLAFVSVFPESFLQSIDSFADSKTCIVMLALLLLPLLFLCAPKLRAARIVKKGFPILYALYMVIVLSIFWLLLSVNFKGLSVMLYEADTIRITYLLSIVVFVLCITVVLLRIAVPDLLCDIPSSFYILVLAAIGSCWGAAMASGSGECVPRTLCNAGTLMFVLFLSVAVKWNNLKNALIVALLSFSLIACGAQKASLAYSWWGAGSSPVWEETEAVNIPELRGFRFTAGDAKMITELVAVIDENTDPDSTVFCFPQTILFNLLTDHVSSEMEYITPIPFYDVCPDSIAEIEARQLSENNPDIVVWVDIPGCLTTHEALFRNGDRLGQRDIQDWFASVKDSRYVLVGQSNNIFVYKSVASGKPAYTYIGNPDAVNETAVSGSS